MTDLPLFRVRNSMSWWAKSKTWLYQEETPNLPWTTACGAIRSIWWSISFLKKKYFCIQYSIIYILIGQTRKPLLQQAVRKPMLVGSAKATILAAKDSQRFAKIGANTDWPNWLRKLAKFILANWCKLHAWERKSDRERLVKWLKFIRFGF